MKKIFAFVLGSILLVASPCFSANVRLAWDHPAPETVGGYRLHFGAMSGVYTSSVDVGNVFVSDLNVGVDDERQVFIAATAYDSAGNQSGYSNEVVFDAPDELAPGAPNNLRITVQLSKTADGTYSISSIRAMTE